MRNTIIDCILEQAKNNPNIILMTADLGYSVMEDFMLKLPHQFINTGIAEQNMIGVAAGLALSGKKVFVYTIAPFATMRCFEQIRVDLCYHNLDVTIIGVGGGFAYGTLGITHYALEDITIMKSLPNMKVFSPADPLEAKFIFNKALHIGGPSYIRLNRGGEDNILERNFDGVDIGDPLQIINKKSKKVIFATGNIVSEAYVATLSLLKKDCPVSLYSMPFIKPLNENEVLDILKDKQYVFSIEEHNVIGGLGSTIADIIAQNNINIELVKLGIQDKYFNLTGKQDYMRNAAGISAEAIEKIIKNY